MNKLVKPFLLVYPKPQTLSAESVSDKLLCLSSVFLLRILLPVKEYYATQRLASFRN